MDITVSTSKLSETKDFYTKLLNFKIVKETPGFISFLPGQGRAKVKNIAIDYSGYLAGRGSPAKRKQNAHIHFVIPHEERQCLSN